METYKLICSDFGWQFSFHAKDNDEATTKKIMWCDYHSFNYSDYSLEVTNSQKHLHNEYIF